MADLDERSRALEAAFFPSHANDYREAIRLREAELVAVNALREASGITDEATLRRLAGLGIRAETLAALTMIPIVEVAWADGEMDERERDAILGGAESVGIEPGSPSYGLLRIWTEDAPAPDLLRRVARVHRRARQRARRPRAHAPAREARRPRPQRRGGRRRHPRASTPSLPKSARSSPPSTAPSSFKKGTP